MICYKYKIVFGLFALAFSFFAFSSSVNAIDSYTYHLDNTNITSSTVPNQTYFYVSSQSDYPNSTFPSYSNPFNFTPKYISIHFNYSGSSTTSSFSLIGHHVAATNNSSYNSFLFTQVHDWSNDFLLTDLKTIEPGLQLSNRTSTGGFWISLSNEASCQNACYQIAIGNLTVDLTFYSDNPIGGSSSTPTGNLDISQNGEYDVTEYASVNVNVPPEIVYGDYHEDLVSIKIGIYTCAAVLLVLYFFYCIYRIIIKGGSL